MSWQTYWLSQAPTESRHVSHANLYRSVWRQKLCCWFSVALSDSFLFELPSISLVCVCVFLSPVTGSQWLSAYCAFDSFWHVCISVCLDACVHIWVCLCIHTSLYPTIFYWVKNYLKPSKTTCGIWHRVQSESNYPCEVLAQYPSYSGSQELPQQPSEGFPELCEGWLPPLVTYCLSNGALQMLTVTGAFSHDLSVRFGLLWSGNSSLGMNVSGTGM